MTTISCYGRQFHDIPRSTSLHSSQLTSCHVLLTRHNTGALAHCSAASRFSQWHDSFRLTAELSLANELATALTCVIKGYKRQKGLRNVNDSKIALHTTPFCYFNRLKKFCNLWWSKRFSRTVVWNCRLTLVFLPCEITSAPLALRNDIRYYP